MSSPHGIATRALHAGLSPDPTTGAILTPIFQSTTYVQEGVGIHKGHTYSRASNPTVSALEANLGGLEDAPPAVCFATGLAAIHALVITLLKAGDHVVCSDVVYGGTHRLLRQVLAPFGVQSSFVDTADAAAVARAITPATKLVFIETPANPTLKLTDVAAIAGVAKGAGVPLAVDNTFLTPVGLRPLDLGADISVYSTTKYIEGHNATVGGSLVTRDERLLERLRFIRKSVGSIQAPFDAWLTLKGVKTLPLRLRQHSENAQRVAEWLERRPGVTRVLYPGLESFPQRELAKKQHGVHAGILAFEVTGGVEAGRRLMEAVELCSLAENLGAAETLITHPATMTHSDIPREEREAAGISDGLVRLSVGLEDPKDIIADLERALAIATAGGRESTPRREAVIAGR
ncbi:MAG: PLP-dependent transferase [Phycisphaerales bacterium]|nr:PLP-dependent transferase [Phycisphaerales bacterium]